MNSVVIIPARLESIRLPNKLLLDETGKPLILYTIDAAKKYFGNVIIATEDREIYEACQNYADVRLTGKHNSGTARIAALASKNNWDIIINWQGDEPELDGQYVQDMLVDFDDPNIDIVTLAALASPEEYNSPDVVKVVVTHENMAMYFSRCPIPHNGQSIALKHIGIYAFRREFLLAFPSLEEDQYSCERLEQLNWLQSGFRIKVCIRHIETAGIDTAEEYKAFVKRMGNNV